MVALITSRTTRRTRRRSDMSSGTTRMMNNSLMVQIISKQIFLDLFLELQTGEFDHFEYNQQVSMKLVLPSRLSVLLTSLRLSATAATTTTISARVSL